MLQRSPRILLVLAWNFFDEIASSSAAYAHDGGKFVRPRAAARRMRTRMKAVILCGGQGTRIREASEALPKPMLPIGGKPIVWHIMKMYAAHGVTEFVLCLGYKGWVIKEFFLNYRAMTSDVTVHARQAPRVELHSAAARRRLEGHPRGDRRGHA